MALLVHGREDAASAQLNLLAEWQRADGSVPVMHGQEGPSWTTSLVVTAWSLHFGRLSPRVAAAEKNKRDDSRSESSTLKNIQAGVNWLLGLEGVVVPKHPGGHDPAIPGWPWVEATHSWVEPTAWALIALKASGYGEHPRARQAAALLVDRLLPGGGCNYGNTVVLGRELRPHVQPTGLALLALRHEPDASGKIARSVAYLQRELRPRITPASLAYALLGLAARRAFPNQVDALLERCVEDSAQRDATLELALLTLAAAGNDCPLIID